MLYQSTKAAALLLVSALCPLGAEFWETKSAENWNEKEREKFLHDSPWAKQMTIAQGAVLYGAGGRSGRGPAKRIGNIPKTLELTIRWHSAPPVLAAWRQENATGRASKGSRQRFLNPPDEFYVVSVSGIPRDIARRTGEGRDSLAGNALIKRKDKPDLKAAQVEFRPDAGFTEMFFYFPKTDPIAIGDREVEFEMEIGSAKLKKTFELNKMLIAEEFVI